MRATSLLQIVLALGVVSVVNVAVARAEQAGDPPASQAYRIDNPVNGTTGPAASPVGASSANDRAPVAAFNGVSLFDGAGLPLLQISAPIYVQLPGRGKLRGGGEAGGDSTAAVQELFPSAPSGGGGGLGNVGAPLNVTIPGAPAVSVSEPATLLLLVPAAALLVRRRLSFRPRR